MFHPLWSLTDGTSAPRGRRRKTKFYSAPIELPHKVEKKAKEADTEWLVDRFNRLIDKAKSESELRAYELQIIYVEAQYQLSISHLFLNEIQSKIKALEFQDDEDSVLLLH